MSVLKLAELETLRCPHCGSRRFLTYAYELVRQEIHAGQWQDPLFLDAEAPFLTRVTCLDCDETLMTDWTSEARSALRHQYTDAKSEEL